MLVTKNGVCIDGMKPEILLAIVAMHECYQRRGKTLMLTSVGDGKHMQGSKHYQGLAFDCRISNLGVGEPEKIAKELRLALHPLFDVVLESDHIHVEYDPPNSEAEAPVA